MKTRRMRNKRKTRKGGGILFDGVWKAEPGISGDRLTYSNGEAGFLNIVHPAQMQNHEILAYFDNVDAVMDDFLALYTGTMEKNQEEMRESGYTEMLHAIQSLDTAVEYRRNMDRDFERIDSVTVTDRGREVQRPITTEEKARHRHRTDVLAKLLKALRQAKKPYDAKYESFVKKKEEKETKQFKVSDLDNEEGAEDTGPYVASASPHRRVKHVAPTEEEIDAYLETCRLAKPSCANCGKTDVPLSTCSRCKQVKYCSAVCQKAHWPIHKPDCKPSTVTESYEVGSFPFHLESVHTIDVRGNIFVVGTDKEILGFTTNDRCMGPFHLIINTPEDANYSMSVSERLTEMDKKEELLKRELQAYEKQFSKNPESKETTHAYRICNEIKRRMAGIEIEMTELLTRHQSRKPIDWKAQRDDILKRSKEIKTELRTNPDAELEKELAYLKTEIPKIQKVLDISFPISGIVLIGRHLVVSTKNSIYFESDRTRIGDEAGFVDGPFHMARFHKPTDMKWFTPTLLCIVDTGNNAIRVIDTNTKIAHTFFKTGKYKGQPYTLNQPMGVAIMSDEVGIIVVADTGNHCITIIDIQKIGNEKITKINVIGKGPGWRDGPDCLFNRPEGVCVHNDSIYVADTGNHCIRKLFVKEGIYHAETIAGTPKESGYKNGKKALFSSPCKVTMMDDVIIVADRGNDKVRLVATTLPCIKGI